MFVNFGCFLEVIVFVLVLFGFVVEIGNERVNGFVFFWVNMLDVLYFLDEILVMFWIRIV